jgi:hypothetical protein
MIAIFKTEQSALSFEEKVHNFLKEKRKGYTAEKWGISQVDTVNNLWGVKMPLDYKELGFDTKGLKLEENTCISQKYYDAKDVEIKPNIEGKYLSSKGVEVSPMNLTAKTILTITK